MTYNDLYNFWTTWKQPSATTARMTRTTLKYIGIGTGDTDWTGIKVLQLKHALVILDAALAQKALGAQSRSNYRNYLRNLYKVLAEDGIDLADDSKGRWWPGAPANVPRRSQVAYERFVTWGIGKGIWPFTVNAGNVLAWALYEKTKSNQHWRKDYDHVAKVWNVLTSETKVRDFEFPPLPAKLNAAYATPIEQWPQHLRAEWGKMCAAASSPLRKGGMRAWREITRKKNEHRLALVLGWYKIQQPDEDLASHSWATLLSASNCQAYINWLVVRNGKSTLNPSHTAFLRMVRGLHRFLMGSDRAIIDQFHELTKRCEVEGRDKPVRMVPYGDLQSGFERMCSQVMAEMKTLGRANQGDRARIASMQVEVIILGLLVTRALRSANIIGIQVDRNLVVTKGGYELRFQSSEMKGHRKFETSVPDELIPIIESYLQSGYRALTGRSPSTGDTLLLNREGRAFGRTAFSTKIKRMSRELFGKPVNPHLFRHIVATHAAQVWNVTLPQLAAFLAHRSPLTCMMYYEVTSPALAAARVDECRKSMGR